MTKEKLEKIENLEKAIYEKLKEVEELYHREYPEGRYLSVAIMDRAISFNNRRWQGGEDENFPLDFWRPNDED